jgi:Ca2+-binding RTX toxin-like protein
LTFVDDNNDAGVGSASIATFAATEGTTYHVLVDVYPTAATGDTVLHLTSVDPCPFLEPGGGGPWDGVHIRGTPGNDELVGTDGVDVLCGFGGEDLLVGGLDNDVLLGGKGTDKLRGSPGNDLFDGGPGSDLADFSFSKKRVTVNLGKGTASGEGTDELMGVEDAFGSRYNDKLVGSAGANSLWGFDGVDNLFGLAGDDYLDGGDGNDNLYGGPGNDSCIQGKGSGKLSSC